MILFHVSKERGIFVNYIELSVFIAYFVFMVAIGLYFFSKSKGAGEKDYFLGGRNMGAWVSALSAGASDMSAWVLMGLPASIYLSGMGQTWIAIGLGIGYAVSWIFMAPRLRRFSIAANDSITIPQYLTNRFLSKNKSLQILSAIIFLVAYTIYAASSIKACGTLFNTVMDIDPTVAMYIAAFIIVAYTFLGGFSAVCWTDFFQGMIMLAALLIAPCSLWRWPKQATVPRPARPCQTASSTSSPPLRTSFPALAGALATSVCPTSSSGLCP